MSIAALTTALAPSVIRGLLKALREVGRWLLERILARGAALTATYLQEKAYDFERRRMAVRDELKLWSSTGSDRRAPERLRLVRQHQWHQLRRNAWTRVGKWLAKHRSELAKPAVEAYCRASAKVLERIPLMGQIERCPA